MSTRGLCPECNAPIETCAECQEPDCGFYQHLQAACDSERGRAYRAMILRKKERINASQL